MAFNLNRLLCSSPNGISDERNADASIEQKLLSDKERISLLSYESELGVDPSSQYFTKRTKSIAFMLKLQGQWLSLTHDYFNQNAGYNDFSGGYKRFYDTLPASFVREPATIKLLESFQERYCIPEGELVLLQMQTSWVFQGDEGRCLTGQGIHTDGADRALLVVLNRQNIDGARNSIYRDVKGRDAVVKPFVLGEGDALLWKDNKVFHHVEPAQVRDKSVRDPAFPDHEGCGRRTVIIVHYPAMHYITGEANKNNLLMENETSEKASSSRISLRRLVADNRMSGPSKSEAETEETCNESESSLDSGDISRQADLKNRTPPKTTSERGSWRDSKTEISFRQLASDHQKSKTETEEIPKEPESSPDSLDKPSLEVLYFV